MARQFTKPIDLYLAQKERFKKMASTMVEGHKDLAESGLVDAQELTTGGIRGRARRRLLVAQHHPFGRMLGNPSGRVRGVRGNLPFLPIGEITGLLHSSLRIKELSPGQYTQSFGVGPENVGYAKFILSNTGTRKMVARGYGPEIKHRWTARNKAFMDFFREQEKE